MERLKKANNFKGPQGPVVLAILDGVGYGHSLNPVFAYVYEPTGKIKMRPSEIEDLGISSLAATCLTLLGYEPPEDYTPSIVDIN